MPVNSAFTCLVVCAMSNNLKESKLSLFTPLKENLCKHKSIISESALKAQVIPKRIDYPKSKNHLYQSI